MTNNTESIDTPNRLFSFLSCQRREKTVACEHCGKVILKSDADNQALIPFLLDDNNNDIDNDNNDNTNSNLFPPSLVLEKKAIKTFCNKCYKKLSILDYTKSYDVIEPLKTTTTTTTSTTTTLLWVHGAGGSRAMFRPHAKHFAEHFGYRSILMDLPGHGTLTTTSTLTLESCEMQVKKILEKECNNDKNKVIYIGCSLGAYLGFHILNKLNHQYFFNGAILMDCGQNVGPDCSLKAKFGIWVLRNLSKNMSNKTLMKGMMDGLQKSNADYHLVEVREIWLCLCTIYHIIISSSHFYCFILFLLPTYLHITYSILIITYM